MVREAIESLSNDDVNIGYAVGSFNSIGMRTIGDGTKELLRSKKLEKISLDFQID